ncbi:FtsB family cell division protein [Marinicrinis sediminis]|uniref:Septum formation initiator family protein n=1 Tax=Marinicrinis sediminis TaxID=1652465 RepID=A0ABW5R928_9BACL
MGRESVQTSARRKGAKRRFRLLLFVLSVFLVWAGMTFWHQTGNINASQARLSQLEEKLSELQAKNEQLHEDIEKLNDPEYIEQILRKEHHMVRPGETLFIESK